MALLGACVLKVAELRPKPWSKMTVYDLLLKMIEASNSGKVCIDRNKKKPIQHLSK